jgi:hypothetical protein
MAFPRPPPSKRHLRYSSAQQTSPETVKRLTDLTIEDLQASPVWRYEGGAGAEARVEPVKRESLSQDDDEIFLAATEFKLADSSHHFGFCFPADNTGLDYLQPVILSGSGAVSFWFDGPATPEILTSQWKALGKEPREIFPVSFRCLVPVDGRTVSGNIAGVESPQNLMSGTPVPTIDGETEAAMGSPGGEDRIPTARPVQPRRTTGAVEKRTTRRRKAEMTVEFSQGALRGTGVTHDVSPRGMFVRSTRLPGAGPMLRLKVNLPGGRTLVLTGRVVRDATASSASPAPPGFGLRLAEEWPEYKRLFPKGRNKP